MQRRIKLAALVVSFILYSPLANAIQLDWSGQFSWENQWLNNHQLDRSRPAFDNDVDFVNRGGQYIRGAGERNIIWYSAFLKLNPKIIVNDSVNIKSEWHVGSPIYGFYGRGFPKATDESMNLSGSNKDGMAITAQRYWANLITDFGTIELGRAPIHWGLGAIWNSGDNLFDKYQSTGDMIRVTSKFGNFWFMPSIVKIATGNSVGGSQDSTGATLQGNDDVTDVNIGGKYDNSEEDFELGLMWTHRSGSSSQNSLRANPMGTGSNRMSYNIYDAYAKKRIGRYSLGGELPFFSGNVGALDGAKEFSYKAYAIILEGMYTSDLWDIGLKLGHVPGQPNGATTAAQPAGSQALSAGDTTFRTIYLNKDYKLGLIMFNYNLNGLSGNNPDTVAAGSLKSPYDNPIVNANYLAINPRMKLDKWTLKFTAVLAYASNTVQNNKIFYNYEQRKFFHAIRDQSSFMGKEFDFGLDFKWDENFLVSWDTGLWFPGSYYKFTNFPSLDEFQTSFMFASQLRVGISF